MIHFADKDNYDINPKIMMEEASKSDLKFKVLQNFPTKVIISNDKESLIITPMSYNLNKDRSEFYRQKINLKHLNYLQKIIYRFLNIIYLIILKAVMLIQFIIKII